MTEENFPSEESLTVEFKSDCDCLSDDELIEAVVCLANAEAAVSTSALKTTAASQAFIIPDRHALSRWRPWSPIAPHHRWL